MNIKPKPSKPIFKYSFATHEAAQELSFGKSFLVFLQNEYPMLFPEFANFYEPVNIPVPDEEPIEMLVKYWPAWGGMWARRKNVRALWHWFTPIKMFPDGMSKLSLTMEYSRDFEATKFFDDAKRSLISDFAGLVVDTVEAKADKSKERYIHGEQLSLMCIRTYSEPMVDLCWAQFMSNRFLERFFKDDAERVTKLTAQEIGISKVERTKHGVYWQITDSPMDAEADLAGFNRLRANARMIIGAKYFLDQDDFFLDMTTPRTAPSFAQPSITAVAIEDPQERASAVAAVGKLFDQQKTENVPQWKQVLIDHISDPVKLKEAIAMTEAVMDAPLPDPDKDPEGHQKAVREQAAMLRKAIFPEPQSPQTKKTIFDRFFKRK